MNGSGISLRQRMISTSKSLCIVSRKTKRVSNRICHMSKAAFSIKNFSQMGQSHSKFLQTPEMQLRILLLQTPKYIYISLRSTIHQIDEEDGGERKSILRKKQHMLQRPYHSNRISSDIQITLLFPKGKNGRIWRKNMHLNSEVTRVWLKKSWACLSRIPKVSSGGKGSLCFQR